MRKSLFGILVLLVASPALAAWVGNVADVAPANTVVIQSTGVQYADLPTAFTSAVDGDTLLVGPGTWTWGAGDYMYMGATTGSKRVSIIGSGSNTDPASNSVFDGLGAGGHFVNIQREAGTTPIVFKDVRVQNLPGNGVMLSNQLIPGGGKVTFENMAFYDLGQSGWGDMISFNTGEMVDMVVKNCLMDGGPLATSKAMGIRIANHQSQAGGLLNALIVGNEFKNLRHGITENTWLVRGLRIIDNTFTNINKSPDVDQWNYYSGAAIVVLPRLRNGAALMENVLIQGNTFRDCGIPPRADPVNIHNAGIYMANFTGVTIQNVMIRGNTFQKTGTDMQAGIDLQTTDWPNRDLNFDPATLPTGTPGEFKYICIEQNTFVGLPTDVIGSTTGSPSNPSPVVYPINMAGVNAVGVTELGDSVGGDRKITVADINGNTADVNRDGAVNASDKADLVTKVLMTSVADTDLNRKVDIVDLGNLANLYDLAGQFQNGDTDFNGLIDIVDLGNMANDYDKTYALAPAVAGYIGGANVPEPATLSLLGLLGLGLLRRRSA